MLRRYAHAMGAVAEDRLDLTELQRYVRRITDRWLVERAIVAGARVADAKGALPQRERGPEWVVILVSEHFAGVPWLERVYQAGALWDAAELGAPADVHCYTAAEFSRKQASMPVVRHAVAEGIELLGG